MICGATDQPVQLLTMKSYPSIPHVDDAPDELLASGHLWLLEQLNGALLRFRLRESGVIQFGDADRVYDSPESLPVQYRHAVRHVRSSLDREGLRAAVDNVADVVFFGEAMQYQGTAYDWERTPSFLGFDVWAAETEQFRPPDAVDGIFQRLGLQPVNAVEQELHARDFDPSSYEIPQSAWYDGPATGVVIRDKQGRRAKLPHPELSEADEADRLESTPNPPSATETTAADLAATHATDHRFEACAETLARRNHPVTVDTLYERTLNAIVREVDPRIFDSGAVELSAFRSEIAARTRRYLNDSNV